MFFGLKFNVFQHWWSLLKNLLHISPREVKKKMQLQHNYSIKMREVSITHSQSSFHHHHQYHIVALFFFSHTDYYILFWFKLYPWVLVLAQSTQTIPGRSKFKLSGLAHEKWYKNHEMLMLYWLRSLDWLLPGATICIIAHLTGCLAFSWAMNDLRLGQLRNIKPIVEVKTRKKNLL